MSTESEILAALMPLVGGRAYFAVLPIGVVYPAIRLSIVTITPENTACGASDLDDYRIQVDLFGPSYGALVGLRSQVFAAIEAALPFAERINDMTDYDNDLKLHTRIIEYGIKAA